MFDAAATRGLFAMEAMWPRFTPAADVLRQVLDSGILGGIQGLQADLGEAYAPDPAHRLYDPALGGGTLLDMGIYLAAMSVFCVGAPQQVHATGSLAGTGVVASAALHLRSGAAASQLLTTLSSRAPRYAVLSGTRGALAVGPPFYLPGRLAFTGPDRRTHTTDFALSDPEVALCFEAAEAARCVAKGRTESPLMPWADTLAVVGILDDAAAQIGAQGGD